MKNKSPPDYYFYHKRKPVVAATGYFKLIKTYKMTKTQKKKVVDDIIWNITACENINDLPVGIEKLVKEVYSSGFSYDMQSKVSNTLNSIVNNELKNLAENIHKHEKEKIEIMRPVGNTIFALIDSSSLPD